MAKKDVWKLVVQTLITILTAIGTSLGVVGCTM
ncbi:MAG: smalltalk protein [Bacteroides sp.]|nr:smalltalk protein [Bacteroides sp.]